MGGVDGGVDDVVVDRVEDVVSPLSLFKSDCTGSDWSVLFFTSPTLVWIDLILSINLFISVFFCSNSANFSAKFCSNWTFCCRTSANSCSSWAMRANCTFPPVVLASSSYAICSLNLASVALKASIFVLASLT